MGSKVGALFIDMAMNTAAFASDLSKSSNALNSWASSSNKTLAKAVNGWRSVGKEVDGFISRSFTLRNVFLTLAGGTAAGAVFTKFIKNTIDAQNEQAQLEAVLRSTGNAAGYTSQQLNAMAQSLSRSSIFSAGEITNAQVRLLSYTGVMGENLPRAMQSVIDQSARLGIGLEQSAETIGRALERPSKAAAALSRQGFGAAFTKETVDMLKALEKQGDMAQAQVKIIEVLEESYRGAAEAAKNTLGGALSNLNNVFQEMLTSEGGLPQLTALINDFSGFLRNAAKDSNVLETASYGLAASLLEVYSAWQQMAARNAQRINIFGVMDDDIAEYEENVKRAQAAIDRLGDELLAKKVEVTPVQFGQPQLPTLELPPINDEALEDADRKFKKLQDAAQRVKQNSQGAFGNYINDVSELDKMLKANLITWDEYGNAVRQAQEKHFKITERVKKVTGETENAQEKYNETMKELNALVGIEGGLSWEQYEEAVARANAELRKAQLEGTIFGSLMDKAIDGNIKSWRDLGAAVLDYARQVLKAVAAGQSLSTATGGGSGGGGLFGGLLSLGGSIFSGGFSQSFGFATSAPGTYGPFPSFHSGGVVGGAGGGSRLINPSVFANAPRFHNGGLVGDEVPIIAQKGERVLTKQQQRDGMGNSVVYNIDARGAEAGVEQRLKAMIMEVSQSIEPRSISAVTNARYRNPKLFNGS